MNRCPMRNIDKQVLREAAEKSISEEGETWWNEEQLASDYGLALHRADAKFIAAASPATVLALLDELEAAEHTAAVDHEAACSLVEENEELKRRIAELEVLALSQAATDVLAERRRQVTAEGWTSESDDQYEDGELIDAAACYAQDSSLWNCIGEPPSDWPWSDEWWKPSKNMRRNLVKAGALILAEIERRDRAAGIGKGE